jgi:type II secretory pathway predicted ATPase ExeA
VSNKKLLNLYGLKWNPFDPALPLEGLISSPQIDSFCWRVENLVMDGGYAMITGHPGTGKSVALRILAARLNKMQDVKVGVLTRPQSGLSDFYRELGELFGVELKTSNRWGGYKTLRKGWMDHIRSTLLRPVLLIDESQEMLPAVLNELRMMMSENFDSEMILTLVLCGDNRLPEKFREPTLIPLGSRIRVRMTQESATKEQLEKTLLESMAKAGNANLMSKELVNTLVEHASGNYRVMMIMADNLLSEGMAKDVDQLNEKLFFEIYSTPQKTKQKK